MLVTILLSTNESFLSNDSSKLECFIKTGYQAIFQDDNKDTIKLNCYELLSFIGTEFYFLPNEFPISTDYIYLFEHKLLYFLRIYNRNLSNPII